MPFVEPKSETLIADIAQGKLGKPNEYADIFYGLSDFGDCNDASGYYQIRHGRRGRAVFKQRHQWPTQSDSAGQQASRAKFAAATQSWAALGEIEKDVWRKKAQKLPMNGWNLFIKHAMLS